MLERSWDRPLTHQNQVLAAEDLYLDGEVTVFYVENQSVVIWGYRGSEEDPPVFERLNDPTAAWVPLGVRMSEFLTQTAIFEASFGPHSLAREGVREAQLGRVVAETEEVQGVVFPGVRLFVGEDFVVSASAMEELPEPTHLIILSGRSLDVLDRMDSVGIDWSYDSRTST